MQVLQHFFSKVTKIFSLTFYYFKKHFNFLQSLWQTHFLSKPCWYHSFFFSLYLHVTPWTHFTVFPIKFIICISNLVKGGLKHQMFYFFYWEKVCKNENCACLHFRSFDQENHSSDFDSKKVLKMWQSIWYIKCL